jgi:hypothetical protein
MAYYYLKNFIKTSNNYQNYKIIAISYRIDPETTSNIITNSINGISCNNSNSLPTLSTDYYTIKKDGSLGYVLYDLKLSDIYTNSIAPNRICRILDSNSGYIWYINFATVNSNGIVDFTLSGTSGGIINYINGTNLSIDINTNSIIDHNLPALNNVTLWGVNSASYCSSNAVKTIIGNIIPSYGA